MKTVPHHVQAEIKRYDPKLRVRWSGERKSFVIERMIPRSLLCDPRFGLRPVVFKKDRNGKMCEHVMDDTCDKKIGFRDGYLIVGYTPYMDRRLFWSLYATDSRRLKRGTLGESVEKAEEAEDAKFEAKAMDEAGQVSKQISRYMSRHGHKEV